MSNGMKVAIFGPVDYYNNKIVEQAIADCGYAIAEVFTTEDAGVAAAVRFICDVKKITCRVLAPNWDDLTAPKAEIRTNKDTGRKYNHKAGVDRNKSLVDVADAVIIIAVGKPSTALVKIKEWVEEQDKHLYILNVPA